MTGGGSMAERSSDMPLRVPPSPGFGATSASFDNGTLSGLWLAKVKRKIFTF